MKINYHLKIENVDSSISTMFLKQLCQIEHVAMIESFISVLFNIANTSHIWLLSPWNVFNESDELNFTF